MASQSSWLVVGARQAGGGAHVRDGAEHEHGHGGGGHRRGKRTGGGGPPQQPHDDERGERGCGHGRGARHPAPEPGVRAGVAVHQRQVVRAREATGLRRLEDQCRGQADKTDGDDVAGGRRDAIERTRRAPAGMQQRHVRRGGRRHGRADQRQREQRGADLRDGQRVQRQTGDGHEQRAGERRLVTARRVHRRGGEREAGRELDGESRRRCTAGREVRMLPRLGDGQHGERRGRRGEPGQYVPTVDAAILAPAVARRQGQRNERLRAATRIGEDRCLPRPEPGRAPMRRRSRERTIAP